MSRSNSRREPQRVRTLVCRVPVTASSSSRSRIYEAKRPTISEDDTLETPLSVQSLDAATEAACE